MRVPETGNFVRVLHDQELGGYIENENYDFRPRQLAWNLRTRDAVPENRKTRPYHNGRAYDYVQVPEPHQWFLWNLLDHYSGKQLPTGKIEGTRDVVIKGENITLSLFTEGSLTYAYGDLIQIARDFTDARPVEIGRRDRPTGRFLDQPKTWEWRCIVHGGSLLKLTGRNRNGYLEFEAIDLLKPPPTMAEVEAKPWLINWAVEVTVNELPPLNGKKRWTVSEFPQLKVPLKFHGYEISGTPYPVWSLGGVNYIHPKFVTPAQNGSTWSPYVPEK